VNAPPRAAAAAIATPAVAMVPRNAPPVIKRGDPVTIEAGSDGFAITRDGVAMGDAPAGGRLLIRVDDGGKPVQGVAVAAGRATLPGWPE
ncbi:flagella basal body P-ring formation protein FlgA, partial [Staphylococcus agnetis]